MINFTLCTFYHKERKNNTGATEAPTGLIRLLVKAPEFPVAELSSRQEPLIELMWFFKSAKEKPTFYKIFPFLLSVCKSYTSHVISFTLLAGQRNVACGMWISSSFLNPSMELRASFRTARGGFTRDLTLDSAVTRSNLSYCRRY